MAELVFLALRPIRECCDTCIGLPELTLPSLPELLPEFCLFAAKLLGFRVFGIIISILHSTQSPKD